VFGPKPGTPFTPSAVRKRAAAAWAAENKKRAENKLAPLVPIGLHELRHSYVSLMHDAGFTLEEIAPYVGHGATTMVERYRHLLEGHESKTAARFDAYLQLADTASRVEQLG
jgi:integrase